MNTFARLLLISSLLLPLAACNDSQAVSPLPEPGSNAIPRDEGQNTPPVSPPVTKGPEGNAQRGNSQSGSSQPGSGNSGSGGSGNAGSGNSGGGNSGGGNPSAPVPEPGMLFLVGAGLAMVAHRRRKYQTDETEEE